MLQPERVECVVMCACVLHNLLRIRNRVAGEADEEHPETHEVIPGAWRQDQPLPGVVTRHVRGTQAGKENRDHLRNFFVSDAGSVPWQLAQI